MKTQNKVVPLAVSRAPTNINLPVRKNTFLYTGNVYKLLYSGKCNNKC